MIYTNINNLHKFFQKTIGQVIASSFAQKKVIASGRFWCLLRADFSYKYIHNRISFYYEALLEINNFVLFHSFIVIIDTQMAFCATLIITCFHLDLFSVWVNHTYFIEFWRIIWLVSELHGNFTYPVLLCSRSFIMPSLRINV